MKSRNKVKLSSDGSQDTDTTDPLVEPKQTDPTWWDVLPFFHFFPYFVLFYGGWYLFNHNILTVLFLIYVVTPLVDILLPLDKRNLENKQVRAYEKDKRFLIPLYTYWVLDFFSYFWAIYTFTYGEFYGILDRLQLIFVTSHIGGVGLAIGHEQLHRRELIHKICGTLVYSKALYSHFFIEHIKGHHKLVATPLDPASAEMGESLYTFVQRSFVG